MKTYKCPFCDESTVELEAMHHHLEEEHGDSIPKGESSAEFYYTARTGKTHGNCVVCKNKTSWNPATNKYHRFCDRPSCKETYVNEFKKRMIGKHGKETLLNDPEQQKKMLAHRSISGEYKWSDGKMKCYTGSYEKDFLQFLDLFMEFDSSDVFAPSPHTFYYEYEGKKHFYIPDFYIASLNLEIEIKDGGNNPNNHHKIQRVDKVKEKKKDEVMASQKEYNYIKVVNKEYGGFVNYLLKRKADFSEDSNHKLKADFIVTESMATIGAMQSFVPSNQLNGKSNYMLLLDRLEDEYNYDKLSIPDFVYRTCWDCKIATTTNDSYQRINEPVSLYDFKNPLGIITPSVNTSLISVLEAIRVKEEAPMARQQFRETLTNLIGQVDDQNELIILRRDAIVSSLLLQEMIDYQGEAVKDYLPLCNWIQRDYMKQLVDYEKEKFGECTDPELAEISSLMEGATYSTSQGNNMHPVYVLLTHSGTLLANTIKKVTNNPYSHSSISFDPQLENMYSFGRKYKSNPLIGTFVRESIKEGLYEEVANRATYSLYVTFVNDEEYQAMQKQLASFRDSDKKFKYNFIGLIRHQFGVETNRDDAFFCSEFVNTILTASGKDYIGKPSSLVKPYDFAKNKEFHFVTRGILSFYDPKKVEEKVEKLINQQLENE